MRLRCYPAKVAQSSTLHLPQPKTAPIAPRRPIRTVQQAGTVSPLIDIMIVDMQLMHLNTLKIELDLKLD